MKKQYRGTTMEQGRNSIEELQWNSEETVWRNYNGTGKKQYRGTTMEQ